MADTPFDLLETEWIRRQEWNDDEIDTMVGLWEGNIPNDYERYFPSGSPKQLVNLVKLAWSDLATQTGRIPDLRGDPANESDAEAKRIGRFEHIGHSYLRNAEPSAKIFMRLLAWWLIGAGRAVVLIRPDNEQKAPVPVLRDPRTCRPKFSRTSSGMPVEVDSLLFCREVSREEAIDMGVPAKARSQRPMDTIFGDTEETEKVKVYEYIDKHFWIIASDGGSKRVKHDLGVVPGWFFKNYGGDRKGGISLFKDQVGLMVQVSLMISMKIAQADRLLNPVYWAKGHEGKIKIGPAIINKLSDDGEIGRLDPPSLIQVDRDIDQLTTFSRILNRNPETRQGEIQSRGQYVSAKTVEQLAEAIDSVIGEYWDLISVGLQKLMAICFRMDEKLWPNETKTVAFVRKGTYKRLEYTPAKDINGRYHINVEYGFSLGGYQGFLQNLQAKEAKVMPRRRVIEEMPGVSDVDRVMREIDLEDMDDAGKALFQQLAATGQLDAIIWAKLRKEMAEKGMPLQDAILKYQEELQAQAQAAVDNGGAEAFTAAPGAAPAEEEAGPPGIPPSVAAGMA